MYVRPLGPLDDAWRVRLPHGLIDAHEKKQRLTAPGTAGVRADGTLVCFGSNSGGQCTKSQVAVDSVPKDQDQEKIVWSPRKSSDSRRLELLEFGGATLVSVGS